MGRSFRNHHRCGNCKRVKNYTCSICGYELKYNGKVFCDPCIKLRRREDQRQRYSKNPLRRFKSTLIKQKRHCMMCDKYKHKGMGRPLCKGDCHRIYNRLMQQVSRSRRYGK
jgi:uncharacterized Zn finger protein (UPF0148 family)